MKPKLFFHLIYMRFPGFSQFYEYYFAHLQYIVRTLEIDTGIILLT